MATNNVDSGFIKSKRNQSCSYLKSYDKETKVMIFTAFAVNFSTTSLIKVKASHEIKSNQELIYYYKLLFSACKSHNNKVVVRNKLNQSADVTTL